MKQETPMLAEKFIFIKEMSRLLDMSPGSLRINIHRKSGACPPGYIKIGKRIAWKRSDYINWLNTL